MSRGLGSLQREVKTIVSDYTDWFCGKYVFPESNPDQAPWLTWPIIRNLYFQVHGLDSSITALISVHSSLERSLKRALKSLVDRGEICMVPFPVGGHHTTPEQFQNSISMLSLGMTRPNPKQHGRRDECRPIMGLTPRER